MAFGHFYLIGSNVNLFLTNVLKWHSPTLKKRGDEMKKYDFIANF